jgi:RNA polymerase sigma-70 factor, ECF subfamily
MTSRLSGDDLLLLAREGDATAVGALLEGLRDGLRARADRQLRQRLRTRVDASDVIQVTFLEAHKGFPQFDGADTRAFRSWVERILDNALAKAVRDHTRLQKRDVRREQPLDTGPADASGPRPEPDAQVSTPSQRVSRLEDQARLLAALDRLPPDQHEAVRLRHLLNWPLADIARHMGRTPAAAAGLIKRGVQTLRAHLRASETECPADPTPPT